MERGYGKKTGNSLMIKILDRYIIKKYLSTFFFMLGVVMLLAMVFDISERLGDFIQKEAPIKGIFLEYYLNFLLYYGNLFSPLIVFLSVIWFTAKMAQNSEIIPMINSGRNFLRLLRPYMIGATILMLISLVMNHFVLPQANRVRLQFEEDYYRSVRRVSNYYAQFPGKKTVYFDSYRSDINRVLGLVVEQRDENNRVISIVRAREAINADSTFNWELQDYFIRYIGHPHDRIVVGPPRETMDTVLPFQLAEMAQRQSIVQTMGYNEIRDFIEYEREKGNPDIPFFEIEFYQRTSFPFATYVLTLIGMAVSSRKSRGGVGVNIAIGLALAFLYIFAMKVTTVASVNVGFPTWMAVWVPNLIFAVLGIWLYRLAPK
jgi:lipopolysaccharide export system permease protein